MKPTDDCGQKRGVGVGWAWCRKGGGAVAGGLGSHKCGGRDDSNSRRSRADRKR